MTTTLHVPAPPLRAARRRGVKPTLLIGLVLLLVLLLAALFPRLFTPYSPTDFDYTAIWRSTRVP